MAALGATTVVVAGPYAPLLIATNRFTSKGEYGNTVFDVSTKTLPDFAAMTALNIYLARLVVALARIPDSQTSALVSAASKALAGGYKTIVPYVVANMGAMATAINAFADAQGLPAWEPGASSSSKTMISVGVAAVAAALLFWRRAS